MINRRRFVGVAGALVIWPFATGAQQTDKVWRIGVLASAPGDSPLLKAFREGMRELGYVEGKNIRIEYRFAAGRNDLLPQLAAELVRSDVDLILVDGNAATHAAKTATATIPVVMGTSGDPLSSGAVRSLSHPGGNVTGLTLLGVELSGKKLEFLAASLRKRITQFALLINPTNPQAEPLRVETARVAQSLGLRFVALPAAHPSQLDEPFETAVKRGIDAMITMPDAMFWNYRKRLVDLTAAARLPTIYAEREFVEVGGLMSYGSSVSENFRRAASFVDKIFKGAKPGDLPVEQPTRFELAINLKTARALDLTIPQSLLLRADEVIE